MAVRKTALVVLFLFTLMAFSWLLRRDAQHLQGFISSVGRNTRPTGIMTVVYAICEGQYNLSLVAIKSVIAYSVTPLHLVVLADDKNLKKMKQQVKSWPTRLTQRVRCDVLPLWFPKENYHVWLSLEHDKPCTTQKLFLSSALPEEEAVIYVDNDVLFVNPVEDFWRMFASMNEWQMAGMAPGTEHKWNSHYPRFAKHPFVKPFGLNAGVLLMNLTRMRTFGLERRVEELRREFGEKLVYKDQDLLNIVFARHPLGLFTFTCRWNYRYDHCTGAALCADSPVAVLHGFPRAFLLGTDPGFAAVHQAMQKYKFGERLVDNFIAPLKKRLTELKNTDCVKEFNMQLDLWRLQALRVDNASYGRPHSIASPYR